MHEYFERRYVAENIVVAVAGNFSWRECDRSAGEALRRLAVRQGPAQEHSPRRARDFFEVQPKKKILQEHVFLIAPGPAATSPMRHAADTLAMIVGDDSGSRLHWALIDPGLPTRPTSASTITKAPGRSSAI